MESSFKLEVFGSKGLLKILETLIQHGPLNITHLSWKVGMNSGNVDMHLKKLVKYGLVTERRYGKIRMIRPGFTERARRKEFGDELLLPDTSVYP